MAMMGSGTASGEDRARKATEQAIYSPLLEDIDLNGAKGILVNVSASESLSIGEFQEVGEIIKQFSSEDATHVIGTVIDSEMGDNIRVTVVATGLKSAVTGKKLHEVNKEKLNYKDLELPAVNRNRKRAVGDDVVMSAELDEEMLDVPAFLRRQAD